MLLSAVGYPEYKCKNGISPTLYKYNNKAIGNPFIKVRCECGEMNYALVRWLFIMLLLMTDAWWFVSRCIIIPFDLIPRNYQ